LEIATIGFTRTSAEHFFERLKAAHVQRVVDIRLHNESQLAGFAKQPDLAYFLGSICHVTYEHDLRLAPTNELLRRYRADKDWDRYRAGFTRLMRRRNIVRTLDRASFERKTALLCSEATAEHCHRRLLAEALAIAWGASVEHL
jgi:uncharacterized protein (DUF488 family)